MSDNEQDSQNSSQNILKSETIFLELPDHLISESHAIPNDDLQSVALPEPRFDTQNFQSFRDIELDLQRKLNVPLSPKKQEESTPLISHYQQMLQDHISQNQQLQKINDSLREQTDAVKQQKNEAVQKLKDQVNELEKKIAQLEFENEALKSRHLSDNTKDQGYYQEILQSKEKYIQEVLAKVAKFEEILEKKNHQIEILNTQVFELKNKENQLSASNDLLMQKIELFEKANASKLEDCQARLDLSIQELEEEKRQNEIFRSEVIRLKEGSITLEAQKEFDQKRINNLEQQNQYLKNCIQQSDSQIDQLQKTLDMIRNQFSQQSFQQKEIQDTENRSQRNLKFQDFDNNYSKTLKNNSYVNNTIQDPVQDNSFQDLEPSLKVDQKFQPKRNIHVRQKRAQRTKSKTFVKDNFTKQNPQIQNSVDLELQLESTTQKIASLGKQRENLSFEYNKLIQSNLKSGAMIRRRKELEQQLKLVNKELSNLKNELRLMRHVN